VSQALYFALLLLVGAERLLELRLSARNARVMRERGGIEVGAARFGRMRVLHALFLPACALEVLALERPFVAALGFPMLALALAAQALRWWAILSLGPAWNVRVIVAPDQAVRRGPYRFVRHPNYLAVIVEMVAIPLIHGAWITALGFSVANAWILRERIRTEEEALARAGGWEGLFADAPRFLPLRPGRRRAILPDPRRKPGDSH
jgi:methyltransferase